MRTEVQEIFKATPIDKQVMMFSATLAQDMRAICKKFMVEVGICSPIIHPRPPIIAISCCRLCMLLVRVCALLQLYLQMGHVLLAFFVQAVHCCLVLFGRVVYCLPCP